eukprot:Rhum_TRINITY_DN10647_c0_g1::Rhum_TRINITY_DN10647_c0_g1_i1::g.39257::m.39257
MRWTRRLWAVTVLAVVAVLWVQHSTLVAGRAAAQRRRMRGSAAPVQPPRSTPLVWADARGTGGQEGGGGSAAGGEYWNGVLITPQYLEAEEQRQNREEGSADTEEQQAEREEGFIDFEAH